jgi:hypothetical protein
MLKLIEFILANQGQATDYQIIVEGVKLFPLGVELKVNFLPASKSIDVLVP